MIVGHQARIHVLQELLSKKQGGLSLLLWGPEQTGKKTIALELVRALLCERHAWGGCVKDKKCPVCDSYEKSHIANDFLLVDRSLREEVKKDEKGDMYDMSGVRTVISFLNTKPSAGTFRVVCIDDAHMLKHEAQNALLKTMEEPSSHAVIILVTHKPTALLDTVRSRLMQLYFGLVDEKEMKPWLARFSDNEKKIEKALRYGLMRPGKAYELLTQGGVLELFERHVRAMLALEGAREESLGQRIAMAYALRENGILDDPSIFSLWQIVVRDEVLIDLNLNEYVRILTKSHGKNTLKKRLALLRTLFEMETASDASNSVFKSALEYVASKT